MNLGHIAAFTQNASIETFIPLSKIKTHNDIKKYKARGYNIGYTHNEFKDEFSEINADRIFYCSSPFSTYYFDKDNHILCCIPLFGRDAPTNKPVAKFMNDIISTCTKAVSKKNYTPVLHALPDRMRMEYFNLLLDAGITEGMYDLFILFYTLSDFGCNSISNVNMNRLIASKPAKMIKKTEKSLKTFPNIVTVYRGEGEQSTPTNEAWSWTLDINRANFFASRYGNQGARILTATVPKTKIVEYIDERNEQECLINPADVTILETLNLYSAGLIDSIHKDTIAMYQSYRNLMIETLEFDSEVHGAMHSARVLLLSLLIADLYNISYTDKELLAEATIYHDIGRQDDSVDDEHGARSAEYYLADSFSSNPIVAFLIKYHCLPDEAGYAQIKSEPILSADAERVTMLYKIVKDSDGLERIRFGIPDLDIRQLRLDESRKMTMVARLLLEGIKLIDKV